MMPRWRWLVVAAFVAGCKTVPPPEPVVPVITWEQKLAWMVRLEDQRLLRDPNPVPPAILRPATQLLPAIVGPPAPSDLIRMTTDEEARVRRRAALALGRVGLPAAVPSLTTLLTDAEPEVRQMAAFALGLLGDASARPALQAALADVEPIVQGRAAEALGQIGDRSDAAAVSAMVQAHVKAGVLAGIGPDDLTHPLAPPVEAARLGIYALVRLASYDALAAAVLDAGRQPVSRWWPIAYALQRLGDPRAAPVLQQLAATPGRYTAAFAIRGLAAAKATAAVPALRAIVERRQADPAVVVQAMRALAALGDATLEPLLLKIIVDPAAADPALQAEAMTTLGAVARADTADLLVDLLASPAPAVRATALRALARVDADTLMITLSGLEPDRDWTVRAALASALGTVPTERSLPLLTALLDDRDQRVVPAVIAALVAAKPPDVEALLTARLRSDDFAVRAAAANGLADLKAVAAVPALVAAYRGSGGDSTYVARAALLGALHRIDPAAARPLLLEALRDQEWAVRVRVAALLKEQGVTEGTDDSIRPAASGAAVDSPAWQAVVAPRFSPRAFIETDKGTIEIELAIVDAPLTTRNFITLARAGFYNGVAIHRVVPDFVIQEGDPRGDGEGGPGHTIRDEINQRPYLRGTVGMALDWEDTGGSQFFITHSPQPHLDGRYTVFGHVVAGMDVVDRIVPWDVVRAVRIRDGVTEEK
jgi:cyclophilin family peptidyl-prolyl cis-trans isomerase/HEAT repeat protein